MIIVHIITRLTRGGADENTLLSCNAQAVQGHVVHLIYGREVSKEMLQRVDKRVVLHNEPYLIRSVHPLNDILATIAITRLLRRLRADIVHTHTSKAGIVGRAAAYLAGAKAIVHGVHILPFLNVGAAEKAIYLAAERTMAWVTDAFVNVSTGMRDSCLHYNIGDPENHYVVPSGMDINSFLHADRLDDASLIKIVPQAAQQQVPIILMVAALEPRKRIIEFLDVFSTVLVRKPNACLVVLGEGADRLRIEQAIEQRKLTGKVFLAGFRTDVERWIARADVCVLASEREGLPRAIVQYAAGARPCVVTDLPGVGIVVKHEVTGFLVPCDQLSEMANPIGRLLSDPILSQSMIEKAHQLDLLPWSVENMTGQLEWIYTKVLSRT